MHLEGESPLRYSPTLTPGDTCRRTCATRKPLSADFSFDTVIPSELVRSQVGAITFDTDQVHVPAERSWRTRDRRSLGLRIFKLSVADGSRAGFLARHRRELPNGQSKCRTQALSNNRSPVSSELTGAAGTEISVLACSSSANPRHRWTNRVARTGGRV